MTTLFLLRSFGDFVVALSGWKYGIPENRFQIVASKHLEPLYQAIQTKCHFPQELSIQFVDFGIQHNLMACFTNRYLFSKQTFSELRAFKTYLKQKAFHTNLVLEQNKRAALVELSTGYRFHKVHDGRDNIYTAYEQFWGCRNSGAKNVASEAAIHPQRIIITPGSRKPNKHLPNKLVQQLVEQYNNKGIEVMVAGLPNELKEYRIPTTPIHTFTALVDILVSADLIISADSLPAHLAVLFNKEHVIYYNNKINHPWTTPHGIHQVF